MILSPQFNCFSLHRERGNVLSEICYTRNEAQAKMEKEPRAKMPERKKSHAKTQSRKDRIRKEFLWMKAARETEVGSSVIGPKVSPAVSGSWYLPSFAALRLGVRFFPFWRLSVARRIISVQGNQSDDRKPHPVGASVFLLPMGLSACFPNAVVHPPKRR
jgi:hypothetical protein